MLPGRNWVLHSNPCFMGLLRGTHVRRLTHACWKKEIQVDSTSWAVHIQVWINQPKSGYGNSPKNNQTGGFPWNSSFSGDATNHSNPISRTGETQLLPSIGIEYQVMLLESTWWCQTPKNNPPTKIQKRLYVGYWLQKEFNKYHCSNGIPEKGWLRWLY